MSAPWTEIGKLQMDLDELKREVQRKVPNHEMDQVSRRFSKLEQTIHHLEHTVQHLEQNVQTLKEQVETIRQGCVGGNL